MTDKELSKFDLIDEKFEYDAHGCRLDVNFAISLLQKDLITFPDIVDAFKEAGKRCKKPHLRQLFWDQHEKLIDFLFESQKINKETTSYLLNALTYADEFSYFVEKEFLSRILKNDFADFKDIVDKGSQLKHFSGTALHYLMYSNYDINEWYSQKLLTDSDLKYFYDSVVKNTEDFETLYRNTRIICLMLKEQCIQFLDLVDAVKIHEVNANFIWNCDLESFSKVSQDPPKKLIDLTLSLIDSAKTLEAFCESHRHCECNKFVFENHYLLKDFLEKISTIDNASLSNVLFMVSQNFRSFQEHDVFSSENIQALKQLLVDIWSLIQELDLSEKDQSKLKEAFSNTEFMNFLIDRNLLSDKMLSNVFNLLSQHALKNTNFIEALLKKNLISFEQLIDISLDDEKFASILLHDSELFKVISELNDFDALKFLKLATFNSQTFLELARNSEALDVLLKNDLLTYEKFADLAEQYDVLVQFCSIQSSSFKNYSESELKHLYEKLSEEQIKELILSNIEEEEIRHAPTATGSVWYTYVENTDLYVDLIEHFSKVDEQFKEKFAQCIMSGYFSFYPVAESEVFQSLDEKGLLDAEFVRSLLIKIPAFRDDLVERGFESFFDNTSLTSKVVRESIVDNELIKELNLEANIFNTINFWLLNTKVVDEYRMSDGTCSRSEVDQELVDLNELNEKIHMLSSFNLTEEQKLKISEVLKRSEVARNKLKDIIDNNLENEYDFESLTSYLTKREKKNELNI